MRFPFNKWAAIWTFVAIIAAYIIVTVATEASNQGSISLLGSLVYGILGLFASIITGLMVHPKKQKRIAISDYDLKDEDKKEAKNGNKTKTRKTKRNTP